MLRTKWLSLGVVALLAPAAPAWADDAPAPAAEAAAADAAPVDVGRVLKALDLPAFAQSAREAGVDPEDLKATLGELKKRHVPAGEARDLLEAENDTTREHGPIDGLGGFVRDRLDEGQRGPELAAAIRAERDRRRAERRAAGPIRRGNAGPDVRANDGSGDGSGDAVGRGRGRPEGAGPGMGKGRPDGAGPGAGAGRPDGAGPGAGAGRPDGAGPGAGAGRPDGAGPGAGRGRDADAGPGMGKGRPDGAGPGGGRGGRPENPGKPAQPGRPEGGKP